MFCWKSPCLLLDLLPNVLRKASSMSVVFVLLALSLKPGKIGSTKALHGLASLATPEALLQLLGSAQTFEVL